MKTLSIALLSGALAIAGAVEAQTSVRVRGTIAALEGNVLAVKSRDGSDLRIHLAENVAVATTKAISLAELKPGDYVGSAAMKRADGVLVALEVHTLPRAVPEGHGPWDLQPGSTMTNATISALVHSAQGRELTLQHKGGTQTILVPEGAPVVTAVPADRSALRSGETVFLVAQVAADGRMTAARVQVSKDGVRPPQ